MKKIAYIFLTIMLVLLPVMANAQLVPQTTYNNQGQLFFRVINNTQYYYSCFYRDAYNYFTFSLAPGYTSMWYPVYGQYEWRCN
jgi:hypothetical protein